MIEPAPAEQLEFLSNIQRLLVEGVFTATYKFALLLSLADLSVEGPFAPEAMLVLDLRRIAEKFVEYYWPQTVPFISHGATNGRVLFQNSNPEKEAAILGILQEVRSTSHGSIVKARLNRDLWRRAITRVARLIEIMPLWKLQTMGTQHVCFLYENSWAEGRRGIIKLKPGVASNFRRFYQLIQSLVKDAWVRYIQKLSVNSAILGQTTDLHEFLFGSERQNLTRFVPLLLPLQDRKCFYCGSGMNATPAVDHFIPWSRFSVDLAHNFVLAHPSCNSSKSDFLAASSHLERWINRNNENKDFFQLKFDQLKLPHDLKASIHVAKWAYEQAEMSHALLWLRAKELSPIDTGWRQLFE